jgi:hypothetical protein
MVMRAMTISMEEQALILLLEEVAAISFLEVTVLIASAAEGEVILLSVGQA